MSESSQIRNMGIYCDFENIALGVKEAKYEAFHIKKGAGAAAPEGQHRRQEGLLRLGPLQ